MLKKERKGCITLAVSRRELGHHDVISNGEPGKWEILGFHNKRCYYLFRVPCGGIEQRHPDSINVGYDDGEG
jgi:hypothetical protein